MTDKSDKLQKVLALAGLGSRREMEKWIEQGCIKVNDQIATIGSRVTAKDKIKVKGKLIKNPLKQIIRRRVIMVHKPQGVICSRKDPEGRKTVYDLLKKYNPNKWVLVGRLDINTSGLLLLTNDGELAHRLMHPSFEVEREYAVRVLGEVTEEIQRALLSGVTLDDGTVAAFDTLIPAGGEGANQWFHVTLHEGKNREVRRLFESQGLQVSRLTRIRYGKITLPRWLSRGKYHELTIEQIAYLAAAVGLE